MGVAVEWLVPRVASRLLIRGWRQVEGQGALGSDPS